MSKVRMRALEQNVIAELEQRKASSQQPAPAAEVMVALGASEEGFWSALEILVAGHQVQTAVIQRRSDAGPWLAIWPTGVVMAANGWSNAAHSGLFGRDYLTPRLPRRPDPSRDPRPDLGSAARGQSRGGRATQTKRLMDRMAADLKEKL